ncbi:MAG: hypothetical protein A2V88_13240 [Elusimicrobia bacterium RBG_16_66_12]|nr:MAG: hypothetical protein A2V88_13240 [Elusimicrobia bacterium RBG_16_66_12]
MSESLDREIERLLASAGDQAFQDSYGMVGPEEGKLLEMLVGASGARRALEIGSGIGLSTLHLARGLAGTGGSLLTYEADPAKAALCRKTLARAGLGGAVELVEGDYLDHASAALGEFDLVFSDGRKTDNTLYFDAFFPALRVGGLIAAHDALCRENVKMRDYLDLLKLHPSLRTVLVSAEPRAEPGEPRWGAGFALSRKTDALQDGIPWSRRRAGLEVAARPDECPGTVPAYEVLQSYQDDYGGLCQHLLVRPGASAAEIRRLGEAFLRERQGQLHVSAHVFDDEDAFRRRDDFHYSRERYFAHLLAHIHRHPRFLSDEIRFFPAKTTFVFARQN